MGVIQRQSLKYTLINFIGTFIGFLSVIFIYPLDKEIYGYFQFIYSYGSLIVPFLGLGIHGAIIKFYPVFVSKNKEKNYLSFTLLMATICVVFTSTILIVVYNIFRSQLSSIFDNFQVIEENKIIILVLGIILLYTSIIIYHASSRLRIVIPDLINSVGLKLFLPGVVFLYASNLLTQKQFVYVFLIYFIFVCFSLLVYLLSISSHSFEPTLNTLDKREYAGFFKYMGFASLNSLGASLTFRMDLVMIGPMMGIQYVQIYALILVISNVMDIPSKALNQIAEPIISSSWEIGDKGNIQNIYQKSSLYGVMIGVLLFLMLYFIWPDIIKLMPSGKMEMSESLAVNIFIFLGFAKLVDLTTGINSIIISYSKEYKYHLYFLLMLAFLNLVLNYIFLKNYGIVGAALATFISMLLFNIIKHLYIHYRFGFKLKMRNQIFVFFGGFLIFGIMLFITPTFHPIINIGLKCSLILLFLFGYLWLLDPNREFRTLIFGFYHFLFKLLSQNKMS